MKIPFEINNGVLANEFGVKNERWEVTSGSCYLAESGVASTGILTPKNNSAVFRMVSQEATFQDVYVGFALRNKGLSAIVPEVAWDGCHVFFRYRSPFNLYYASVNRRDNLVVFKKKIPGGVSNNGTYFDIGKPVQCAWVNDAWQSILIGVKNLEGGKVFMSMALNGKIVLSAIDDGSVGGPAITLAGKVGIRGDNAYLDFMDFNVVQN